MMAGWLEGRAEDEVMVRAREGIERAHLMTAVSVTSDPELQERMEERLRVLQEQLCER